MSSTQAAGGAILAGGAVLIGLACLFAQAPIGELFGAATGAASNETKGALTVGFGALVGGGLLAVFGKPAA